MRAIVPVSRMERRSRPARAPPETPASFGQSDSKRNRVPQEINTRATTGIYAATFAKMRALTFRSNLHRTLTILGHDPAMPVALTYDALIFRRFLVGRSDSTPDPLIKIWYTYQLS